MSVLNYDELKNSQIIQPILEEVRISGRIGTNDDLETINVLSYGCGSMGYDIRLSEETLEEINNISYSIDEYYGEINCKNPETQKEFEKLELKEDEYGKYFRMNPNSTALGMSIETFNIPDDVIGICFGKSTYARCGIGVNITPLEPGWCGRLVIEIINHATSYNRIYANEGIAQIVFLKSDKPPSKNYRNKGGKYQNQSVLTHSIV
jgi:dCTP deaminase